LPQFRRQAVRTTEASTPRGAGLIMEETILGLGAIW
jgi:hypothetical protein